METYIFFKDTAEAAACFPLSQTTWIAGDDALVACTLGSNKKAVSIACADATSALRLKEIMDILAPASVKASGGVFVITDDTDTSLNIVSGLGATTITAADVA